MWKILQGGGRWVAGEVWSQKSVLALPAPSLLHELLGTYICLTPGRKRRLRKDSWAPVPAFPTFQCSAASGALVGKDGCPVLLAGKWMDKATPPWLKPGCLMLLSDVVCTLPEMLLLPDPKNRELQTLGQENVTESCWFAIMLLHPGCYPEKLKFLSPLGLVVKWMAKPQSLQEQENWAFIQVGVFFPSQKCYEAISPTVIKQYLYLSITISLPLLQYANQYTDTCTESNKKTKQNKTQLSLK